MLLSRIITALILIPIVICAIFYLNTIDFAIITALLFLACAIEWLYLAQLATWFNQTIMVILVLGGAYLLWQATLAIQFAVFIIALLWWIYALILVLNYPQTWRWWHIKPLRFIIALVLIMPAWLGLNLIANFQQGRLAVLFVLLFTWAADSGAYFVGRSLGKHKLLPSVSPGKSWEGLLGGVIAGVVITLIGIVVFNLPWLQGLLLSLLSVGFVFVALLGDLTESMFKRQQNVKDSSQLLPGHGGLLDRLDSLFALVPLVALVFLGWSLL